MKALENNSMMESKAKDNITKSERAKGEKDQNWRESDLLLRSRVQLEDPLEQQTIDSQRALCRYQGLIAPMQFVYKP